MHDGELELRAQRAATALERAWAEWRTTHGLGSDPLPLVTSYVGYAHDGPGIDGEPRVVFGISAEEAERLVELFEGHDCAGPARAEITWWPERQSPLETSTNTPKHRLLSVPPQSPKRRFGLAPAARAESPPAGLEVISLPVSADHPGLA